MTDKLLIEALEEMRDTLVKVLIKIRRDAPDLSGKLLGAADQIVARVDALLDAAPPAPAPTAASEREALIERLKAQSLAHRYEAETDSADLIDEAIAALRSTGKPAGEVDSSAKLRQILDLVNETDSARWEIGFRCIVAILYGPKHTFEIKDVVERVRELAATADAPVAEPVGEVLADVDHGVVCNDVRWIKPLDDIPAGSKLYTRPPAPEEGKDAAEVMSVPVTLLKNAKYLLTNAKLPSGMLIVGGRLKHPPAVRDEVVAAIDAALSQGGGA